MEYSASSQMGMRRFSSRFQSVSRRFLENIGSLARNLRSRGHHNESLAKLNVGRVLFFTAQINRSTLLFAPVFRLKTRDGLNEVLICQVLVVVRKLQSILWNDIVETIKTNEMGNLFMYGLLFLLAKEKSNLGQVASAAVKRTSQLVILFLFRGNTSQHLPPIDRREIVFWKCVDEKSSNQSKNYVESLDKLLRKKNRVLKENSIVLCTYLFNRLHVSTSFSFWHSF